MMDNLQLTPNAGPDGKVGTDDDTLVLTYTNPYSPLTLVWQVVGGSTASPTYTTLSLASPPTASGSALSRSTFTPLLSSIASPFAVRVLADNDAILNPSDTTDTTPTIASASVDFIGPTNIGGQFSESANSVITLKFNEAVTINGVIVTAVTDSLISDLKSSMRIELNPPQSGNSTQTGASTVGISGITGWGGDTLSLVTNTTLAAGDIVRIIYPNTNGSAGRITDMSGNPVVYQELWVGGSGATTIDLGDYFADHPIYVRGNGGDDSLTGGQSNDVLLDGLGADVLSGGRGGDVTVLVENGLSASAGASTGNYARDTIMVEPGDSVVGLNGLLRDVIQPSASDPTTSGFDIVSGSAVADYAKHDVLSLPSGKIADNAIKVPGTLYQNASGSNIPFAAHSIVSGIVTFFQDTAGTTPVALNTSQKASDAISYLSKNWGLIPAGDTVALPYDRDGNNTIDSLLIFQQGGKASAGLPTSSPFYLPATHLYIKDLMGASSAVLGTSAGAGVVQIVDTQVPNPINVALLSDASNNSTGIGIDFAERVTVTGTGGLLIKQNGVTPLTPSSVSVSGATSTSNLTVTFGSALTSTDWVLLTLGGVDANNYVTDLSGNRIPVSGGDPTWGGVIVGSAGANTINLGDSSKFDPTKQYDVTAGAGNDVILASASDAYIIGGQGADTISGGGGQDSFDFVQGDSPVVTFSPAVSGATPSSAKFTFGTTGTDVVTDLAGGESIRLGLPFQEYRNIGGLTPMGTGMQAYSGVMPSDGQVGDQAFFIVRGSYATVDGVFTVDTTSGADTLIVYDGTTPTSTNATGVSNTGVVLQAVTPDDLWVFSGGVTRKAPTAPAPTTDNPPAFGNPAFTWDTNNTPLDQRDDKLIVSVTDDDNDGSPGKTLAFNVQAISDGYNSVVGNITSGTASTYERVDFTLQPKSGGTYYSMSLYGVEAAGSSGASVSSTIELTSARFYAYTAPSAAEIVASLMQDPDYAGSPITLAASGSVITASFKQTGDVTPSVMLSERTPSVGASIVAPSLVATAAETTPGSASAPEVQTLTLSPSLVANGVYALKLSSYAPAVVAQAVDSTPTAAELAAALNAAATAAYQPIQVGASGSNLVLTWSSSYSYDITDLAKLFTLAPVAPVSGAIPVSALRAGLDFAGLSNAVSAIRVTATETYGTDIQSTSMDTGLPPPIIQAVEVANATGYASVAEGAQISFVVRLNAPAPAGGYQFDWQLAPPPSGSSATGWATAADFVTATGKVSVIAGASTGTFSLTVADDTLPEFSESFAVQVGTYLDGAFTRLHTYDVYGSIQESDTGTTPPPTTPADPSIVNGTDGNDTLSASAGIDAIVLGLEGNDSVDGLDEGDIFIGGSGNDLAKFAGNASDYIVQKASQGQLDTLGQLVPGGVPSGQDVLAIQNKVGATSWAFVQAEQVQFGTAAPVDPLTLLSGGGGGGVVGGELIVNSSQSGAYASISAAISAATAGATILVAAGHVEANANTPIWISKDNLHIVLKATSLPALTFQLEEVDTIHNLYLFGGTGANIVGNSTDNILLGTQGNDTIDGRGGNDKLMGTGGADQLIGGAGNDWLDGGSGWDTLLGGFGDDMLLADEGGVADTVSGGQADLLVGGSGNDLLMAGESGSAASKIRMLGGSGSDTFRVVNLNGAGSSTSDPAVADAIKLNAYIADLSGADGLDLSALRASSTAAQAIDRLSGAAVAGSSGDWSASLAGLYATGVQGVLAPNAAAGSARPVAPIDQVEAGSILGIAMVNDAAVTAAMARSLGAPSTQSIIDSMIPVYGPLEQFNHQYFS